MMGVVVEEGRRWGGCFDGKEGGGGGLSSWVGVGVGWGGWLVGWVGGWVGR